MYKIKSNSQKEVLTQQRLKPHNKAKTFRRYYSQKEVLTQQRLKLWNLDCLK